MSFPVHFCSHDRACLSDPPGGPTRPATAPISTPIDTASLRQVRDIYDSDYQKLSCADQPRVPTALVEMDTQVECDGRQEYGGRGSAGEHI